MSRVVFLLSSERSGSTLLRVILGRNPAIIAPGELFLLGFPDYETWRRVRPLAIESLVEFLRLVGRPNDPGSLDARWAGCTIAELYRWMLEQLPAGARLLDKTPAYATHRETLDATRFLEPFYIWLIRHPLGVVDSHLRVKRQRTKGFGRIVKRIKEPIQRLLFGGMSRKGRRREDLWVKQNANIRDFLSDVAPEQKYVISFENLVERPAEEVERLCQVLGIRFSPSMLEHPARDVKVIAGLGDANFHRHRKISAAPAFHWRSRLSESALTPAATRMVAEIWRPLRG